MVRVAVIRRLTIRDTPIIYTTAIFIICMEIMWTSTLLKSAASIPMDALVAQVDMMRNTFTDPIVGMKQFHMETIQTIWLLAICITHMETIATIMGH